MWIEEIISSLTLIGGKGSLTEIYAIIQKRNNINFNSFVDWKSQIRKNLYLYSSDCKIFNGTIGDANDIFYSIEGKGKGLWGIRNFQN